MSLLLRIDETTLYLADGLVSVSLAISMFIILATRRTYEGFKQWAASSLLFVVGLVLIALSSQLPRFIGTILGNGAILSFVILFHDGFSTFSGRTPRRIVYLAPALVWLVPCLFFTYVHPDGDARTVLIAAVSLMFLVADVLIYRLRIHKRYGRNLVLPSAFIFLLGLVVLLIVVKLVQTTAIRTWFDSGSIAGILLMAACASWSFVVIGLIVLNTQRTEVELKTTMSEVDALRGIIPICASCKRIRDDKGYWKAVEAYLQEHTEAVFSHSLCPDCAKKLYPWIGTKDRTEPE